MTERLEWQGHRGPVVDTLRDFTVLQCEPCGFKHVVPIPDANHIQALYLEQYYTAEKPQYLEQHQEDVEWWYMVYGERYDVFETQLPSVRRRILDVGSGPGFFLKLGQERGWQTLGIEPSRPAAEHARGLGPEIVNEFLTADNVASFGRFDAVHLHEVLEHIPDPGQMLSLAYRLLDPGGMVCIIVPNDYNPLQQVLRDALDFEPWWLAPPHHINYFDTGSLPRLVAATGFERIHLTTTFPMELFLLMGDNYVGNDAVGRSMHARRKRLELAMARGGRGDLKRELYDRLAALGIGREVVVYAARPDDGPA
jgi:SAM-dependent methyltransferase